MGKSARLGAILVIAMFVASALLVIVPTAMAQASLQPSLKISPLNPGSRKVQVTPSSIGSADFTATVTVTKPPGIGIITVTLDATTSTGWPTVVSPQTIPFTAPGEQQISVVVTVPPATATSAIGEVTVSGVATYAGPTKTASSGATVTIVQYFRMNPQSQQAFITIPPGSKAVLQLDIYNRGNGLDTMSIEFTNIKELKKANWAIVPSSYQVTNVPTDEFNSIKINVEPEKPLIMSYRHGEMNYIQLDVKSDNANMAGQVVQKRFMFAVMLHGFYIPGFDITFLLMALGMVVAFLANRGRKMERKGR